MYVSYKYISVCMAFCPYVCVYTHIYIHIYIIGVCVCVSVLVLVIAFRLLESRSRFNQAAVETEFDHRVPGTAQTLRASGNARAQRQSWWKLLEICQSPLQALSSSP